MSATAERSDAAPGTRQLKWRWQRVGRVAPAAWAWAVLAALLAGTGALLFYLTRGTALWFDEWIWALTRRGSGLGTFLTPYNGHFSLVPVTIYKLLFATAGLGDYRPYRALVIAAHLACVALVFVYASRRVNSFVALCAAALILFLGAAWQDILWPFQIAWLISIAAGVGALIMLDRRDRRGDAIACVLLAISLASSGVGVVVGLGLVVDVLWGRRSWRDGWIVVAPLVLYGLWWLGYEGTNHLYSILSVPRFVADAAAASLGALGGATPPQAGNPFLPDSGSLLTLGRPLAVVAVVLLIWRVVRLTRLPPRALTLLTIVGSFWILTGLTRAGVGPGEAWASRYLYVGGVFTVMLAVDLAQGLTVPRSVQVLLGVGVAAAIASNVGNLRDAAFNLRSQGSLTRADLGALEISRHIVKPDYTAYYLPGFLFIRMEAGAYFAMAHSIGTPAASPAQIATEPEAARQVADQELIRIHQVALVPAPKRTIAGAGPSSAGTVGDAVSARRGCLTWPGGNPHGPPAARQLRFTFPAAGLLLRVKRGTAAVGVRRFADVYESVGTVSARIPVALRIQPDLATRPWQLQVQSRSAVTLCGLR